MSSCERVGEQSLQKDANRFQNAPLHGAAQLRRDAHASVRSSSAYRIAAVALQSESVGVEAGFFRDVIDLIEMRCAHDATMLAVVAAHRNE